MQPAALCVLFSSPADAATWLATLSGLYLARKERLEETDDDGPKQAPRGPFLSANHASTQCVWTHSFTTPAAFFA